MICKKAAAVLFGKGSSESPFVAIQGTKVENLHLEQVAWLGSRNRNRARQVMNLTQVHILDIVRRIIVLDLSSSPVDAFDFENLSFLDGGY
jgi:hypothetical protein